MSRLARLFTSVSVLAALVVGLFSATAFTKAQPAYAGGNESCSKILVNVVCTGDVNLTIVLDKITINILNDNDVKVIRDIIVANNDINVIVVKIKDLLKLKGINVCTFLLNGKVIGNC